MTLAIYGTGAALLAAMAVHAVLVHRHLVRRLLALNVLGGAVFLLLIALGYDESGVVDPVPHALVLTGIVVSVSVTGLALAIAKRLHRLTGRTTLADGEPE